MLAGTPTSTSTGGGGQGSKIACVHRFTQASKFTAESPVHMNRRFRDSNKECTSALHSPGGLTRQPCREKTNSDWANSNLRQTLPCSMLAGTQSWKEPQSDNASTGRRAGRRTIGEHHVVGQVVRKNRRGPRGSRNGDGAGGRLLPQTEEEEPSLPLPD